MHNAPILFCLFVNDLPSSINHSCLKLFADDVKVYFPITNLTEVHLMQEDLDSLTQWSESNFMFLNPSKCVVLHCGRRIPPNYTFLLFGANVPSEEVVRDFGIHIDTQLKFDKHVSAITRNTNYRLSSLKRSFRRFNLRNFLLLYKPPFRPLLEYNTSFWFPLNVMDELRIETYKGGRQGWFLASDLPYKERLSRLDILSLNFRRRRSDLINALRIIKQFVVTNWSLNSNRNSKNGILIPIAT